MKQFVIFFMYFIVSNLSAQNYLAEYYSDTNNEHSGKLWFNTTVWRYDVVAEIKTEFSSDDVDLQNDLLTESDTVSFFNFRSLNKNYYLDEEFAFGGFSSQGKCIIKGELIKPEWIIVPDSMKMIESYTCLLAKGFLCGRNFTVWFTPDIPVSAGPWKLWGLPGLIISARSDDSLVNISMSSLKKTDVFPTEPIVKETISKEEFKISFQKEIEKLKRTIRAMSNESTEIEVTGVNIKMADKSLLE